MLVSQIGLANSLGHLPHGLSPSPTQSHVPTPLAKKKINDFLKKHTLPHKKIGCGFVGAANQPVWPRSQGMCSCHIETKTGGEMVLPPTCLESPLLVRWLIR